MARKPTKKEGILAYLAGKTFPNIREARKAFIKDTGTEVSYIRFYTVVTESDAKDNNLENKKFKIQKFLAETDLTTFDSMRAAFRAYNDKQTDATQKVTYLYFVKIYKGPKAKVKTNELVPQAAPVAPIDLTGKSAKEIVGIVKEKGKVAITTNIKNKKSILNQANKILSGKGFKVLS